MRTVLYALPLLCLPAMAWAGDPPLDVKTGLWETTTVMNSSGTPPIPPELLARMTPQQQAMMQERMKNAMPDQGKPRTDRKCMTQHDIENAFADMQKNPNCTVTMVKATSHLRDADITCQSERMSGSGKIHVEALNPEHVTGSSDIAMGAMHMKGTFEGKWITSNCGDVK